MGDTASQDANFSTLALSAERKGDLEGLPQQWLLGNDVHEALGAVLLAFLEHLQGLQHLHQQLELLLRGNFQYLENISLERLAQHVGKREREEDEEEEDEDEEERERG